MALVAAGLITPAGPAWSATPDFVAREEAKIRWERALRHVQAHEWLAAEAQLRQLDADQPNDARVLTQWAYVQRHLGRLDEAWAMYGRALAIDPDNLEAHEYAGETALLRHDRPAALRHLAALQRLCPQGCEPLNDLQRAVQAAPKKDSR